MKTVENQDIQGFILKGYGKMRATRYYLLRVEDNNLAKKWLDKICNEISDGNHKPETTCLNIAFTHPGLEALGLAPETLRNFAREFREGMATPHRNRLLGDEGSNHPDEWRWGGNAKGDRCDEKNIHILLMVFAIEPAVLNAFCKELETDFLAQGLSIVTPLDGQLLEDNKVHLGFRDGISQPVIEGTHMEGPKENTVATGEFLLGYKNEYGVYPDTPFVTVKQGDLSLLPLDAGGSGLKDLGNNGSYLVFRQMEERVDLFWSYINEKTKNQDGQINIDESIKLAAKMIGRWPSGAPMALYPDADPGGMNNENNFGYTEDKSGLKCPFGSHLRRNNPRDAFEDNSAKRSIKLTKKHRIIRRGRSYGEPLVSSPTDHKPVGEIGLHFMCFNADIAGQFEFIQHTWANFPRFQNLYNDPDPIIGVQELNGEDIQQNFTVQAEPINKCVMDLQRFVTVRGGAYFFFPSIAAIKYLSTI
jgi:Dyp-type peroxidase family